MFGGAAPGGEPRAASPRRRLARRHRGARHLRLPQCDEGSRCRAASFGWQLARSACADKHILTLAHSLKQAAATVERCSAAPVNLRQQRLCLKGKACGNVCGAVVSPVFRALRLQ